MTPSTPSTGTAADKRSRLSTFVDALPFILAHLVCLAAIWTGVHLADLLIALSLYALRVFAITAGYHRYFSHRSFKTSRAFQFVLAVLAQSSAQRGVLWWASTHRHHHRYSDTEEDVHSPIQRGFWYSHVGWIFDPRNETTDLDAIPDFAKYPELRWLERNRYLPAVALGFLVWLFAGWSGLVVGFFWSTVAVWHATFTINSLSHVFGKQRYLTGDTSRNNIWLALLTFGEGWHNNHHHYQSAACQGFRWYEIDITYYLLKGLAALGLVWDLKRPPEAVVRNETRVGKAVVERAARQLAASFPVERIVDDIRAALAERRLRFEDSIDELGHRMEGWQSEVGHRVEGWQHDFSAFVGRWHGRAGEGMGQARHEIDLVIERMHLPAMPSMAELRSRAQSMFAHTPSMNEVVERARQLLVEQVHSELRTLPAPASAPA